MHLLVWFVDVPDDAWNRVTHLVIKPPVHPIEQAERDRSFW